MYEGLPPKATKVPVQGGGIIMRKYTCTNIDVTCLIKDERWQGYAIKVKAVKPVG